MACCGQRRAEIAYAVNATPGPGAVATLESLQKNGFVVRGPATGRHYQFAEGSSTQSVDLRDAHALVRTGLFRLCTSPMR